MHPAAVLGSKQLSPRPFCPSPGYVAGLEGCDGFAVCVGSPRWGEFGVMGIRRRATIRQVHSSVETEVSRGTCCWNRFASKYIIVYRCSWFYFLPSVRESQWPVASGQDGKQPQNLECQGKTNTFFLQTWYTLDG